MAEVRTATSLPSTLPSKDLEDNSFVKELGNESDTGSGIDATQDPENPQNWSYLYKWTIVILLSVMIFIINTAFLLIGPATPQLMAEFHPGRGPAPSIETTFILSIWGLGQTVGPLLLGPPSELYGRSPVYHISTILFIIFSIIGALSVNVSMVIACRFLMGFATAPAALNGPIVGDLFPKERRGTAMSIVNIIPLLGPVVGPIIGDALTKRLGWRWVFWIIAITTGAFELSFAALYRETYYPQILRRKERKERLETKEKTWTKLTQNLKLIAASIYRPIQILFLSPVVFLLTIYVSVVYGYMYLLAGTLTPVFHDIYGLSQGSYGITYLGIGIGMLAGVVFCIFAMDKYYQIWVRAHGGKPEPEGRLMPMILGGIVIPMGLFIYGWGAEKKAPIEVPILGTGIFAIGMSICQVVSTSYLVDAFGIYAASAVAACMTLRFLASALIPLAAPPMYTKIGYGWGNSVLGFVALALIPAPVLLMRYGRRLRERSRYNTLSQSQ